MKLPLDTWLELLVTNNVDVWLEKPRRFGVGVKRFPRLRAVALESAGKIRSDLEERATKRISRAIEKSAAAAMQEINARTSMALIKIYGHESGPEWIVTRCLAGSLLPKFDREGGLSWTPAPSRG